MARSTLISERGHIQSGSGLRSEALLQVGVSYDSSQNLALHTDICSPIATNPRCGKLGDFRTLLEIEGVVLWHKLVQWLRPDIILVSVARAYLRNIRFPRIRDWDVLYRLDRANPYDVLVSEIEVGQGRRASLIFGKAAQLPFGTVSAAVTREIGAAIAKRYNQKCARAWSG